MKKFIYSLLILGFILIRMVTVSATTSNQHDVAVKLTSLFDTGVNNTAEVNGKYGNKLSFDKTVSTIDGYSFGYWVVNDQIYPEYKVNHQFILSDNLKLNAVFKPVGLVLAIFTDTNGSILNIQYVEVGKAPINPSIQVPTKPGYTVSSTNRWGKALEPLAVNTIYVLNYEKINNEKYNLQVINGSSSGYYDFNSVVTITANEAPSGKVFAYWIENDKIVSYESTFTFSMLANRSITAVYLDNTTERLPLVTISNDLKIKSNYHSYLGQFYLPSGYELIEYGIITSMNSMNEIDFETDGINKTSGNRYFPTTKEWVMSFPNEQHYSARAFITVIDSNQNIYTIFSENSINYEKPIVPTLFYETGFEDVSSDTVYTRNTITSSGKAWVTTSTRFSNNTNFTGWKGNGKIASTIRGNIVTGFTITGLYQIQFNYAMYGSDSGCKLGLEVSKDNSTWIKVVDDLVIPTTLTPYSTILDYSKTTFVNNGITNETPLYLRLINIFTSGTPRIMVDDIKLYTANGNAVVTPPIDPPTPPVEEEPIEVPTSDTNSPIITPDLLTRYAYSLNETYINYGCVANDEVDGSVSCTSTTTIDTTKIGSYQITYHAVDKEGNHAYKAERVVVMKDATLLSREMSSYYTGAKGKYGHDLIIALRQIVNNGFVRISYGDVRYAFAKTDVDPSNANNVLCIYDHSSVSKTWDGTTYNREHVWPNSRLGVASVDNSQKNIASDLHNLRAAIVNVNSSRSNKVYDTATTTSTYYPQYDHGQVARIIFYMYTAYSTLDLVDDILPNDTNYNYKPEGAKMARISVLLLWHLKETVDDFELNRNNEIYKIQYNRNPFIDYPHLVELIFWDSPYLISAYSKV